tara:strand:- start:1109 stop:1666 length:558 start_codon:yes stop_codon:yes gene_type:complete
MKLLAGLGNPGDEYQGTPHNVGFRFMDYLAKELSFSGFNKNLDSLFYKKSINGDLCFFIKPQTYMNKSGKAIAYFANYFKIPIENILIISDDINLPPGKARFRIGGGHGGHNGLRSIIDSMGNNKFARVKIGVGRPSSNRDVARHVLDPWSKSDEKIVLDVIKIVVQEVICFLETSKFRNTSFSV